MTNLASIASHLKLLVKCVLSHKLLKPVFSSTDPVLFSVAVEVVSTKTTADVMWKDGCLEKTIRSNNLIPVQHLDTHEFCPGDFVVDKRRKNI